MAAPVPQARLKRDWPMYHDLGGTNEKVPTVRNFIENRSNILFYGPSGCGKTMFAETIANESVEPFYELSGGSTYQTINETFTQAFNHRPSIVFIDDLDQALTTAPLLLHWMNETIRCDRQVHVIGAVDNPSVLEVALVEKFNFSIHFDLPNEAARMEMVPFLLRQLRAEGLDMRGRDVGIDSEGVALQTSGFSVTELKEFLRQFILR